MSSRFPVFFPFFAHITKTSVSHARTPPIVRRLRTGFQKYFSTRQLMDPGLPQQIQTYLDRCHLSPDRLRIEVTEQFILYDAQHARAQMAALEKMGLLIYMDDFGTSYSNLSSVLHYPFSFVKLDRSLIAPVLENTQSAIMIHSLLNLFRELDKRVIMEGVETAEQVTFLRKIGIDMIQGYYFAKPMPAEHLTSYFGPKES